MLAGSEDTRLSALRVNSYLLPRVKQTCFCDINPDRCSLMEQSCWLNVSGWSPCTSLHWQNERGLCLDLSPTLNWDYWFPNFFIRFKHIIPKLHTMGKEIKGRKSSRKCFWHHLHRSVMREGITLSLGHLQNLTKQRMSFCLQQFADVWCPATINWLSMKVTTQSVGVIFLSSAKRSAYSP